MKELIIFPNTDMTEMQGETYLTVKEELEVKNLVKDMGEVEDVLVCKDEDKDEIIKIMRNHDVGAQDYRFHDFVEEEEEELKTLFKLLSELSEREDLEDALFSDGSSNWDIDNLKDFILNRDGSGDEGEPIWFFDGDICKVHNTEDGWDVVYSRVRLDE